MKEEKHLSHSFDGDIHNSKIATSVLLTAEKLKIQDNGSKILAIKVTTGKRFGR